MCSYYKYQSRRIPTFRQYSVKEMQKVFDMGFDKIYLNEDTEIVGAGEFALNNNVKVFASLYWRELHLRVYGDKDQENVLWSGEIPETYSSDDLDAEPEPITKDDLVKFIQERLREVFRAEQVVKEAKVNE